MGYKDQYKVYDANLDDYPEFEEYRKRLSSLKLLSPENTTFKELPDKFFDAAVTLPQSSVLISPDNFNKQKFFRVRLNIDKESEILDLIQTYSYPPGIVCKDNGRANLKGKSVFYCSNTPTAALLESKPKNGDIAHISWWEPQATRQIKAGVCLPISLNANNDFVKIADQMWRYANNIYKQEAKEKLKHLMELDRFIAERFVEEKPPYFLTSWFSDTMLFGPFWRDLIIYPSIASNQDYCNMVFHPNTVNQQLKFKKVIEVKINFVDNFRCGFHLGSVGELDKTNLKWTKSDDKEDLLFRQFGFEVVER